MSYAPPTTIPIKPLIIFLFILTPLFYLKSIVFIFHLTSRVTGHRKARSVRLSMVRWTRLVGCLSLSSRLLPQESSGHALCMPGRISSSSISRAEEAPREPEGAGSGELGATGGP